MMMLVQPSKLLGCGVRVERNELVVVGTHGFRDDGAECESGGTAVVVIMIFKWNGDCSDE